MLKFINTVVLCVTLATQSLAYQDNIADAKNFVATTGTKVESILKEDMNESQKVTKLNNVFLDIMDIQWIAKFVLGKHWKDLSADQQAKYQNAYKEFLISLYVPLFRQYNGDTLKIISAKELGNSQYSVLTHIQRPSGAPYKIEYRIKYLGNEKFMVRDVIAEGISLILTQRSDFDAIVNSKGSQELINGLVNKSIATHQKPVK